MADTTPAAPDFPTQVENAAKAFYAFVEKRYTPNTVAWIVGALKAIATEEIGHVNTALAQSIEKVAGGFLGGLAAPGLEKGADAILTQIEADATAAPTT